MVIGESHPKRSATLCLLSAPRLGSVASFRVTGGEALHRAFGRRCVFGERAPLGHVGVPAKERGEVRKQRVVESLQRVGQAYICDVYTRWGLCGSEQHIGKVSPVAECELIINMFHFLYT